MPTRQERKVPSPLPLGAGGARDDTRSNERGAAGMRNICAVKGRRLRAGGSGRVGDHDLLADLRQLRIGLLFLV